MTAGGEIESRLRPASTAPPPPDRRATVTYLGHAGLVIEADGQRLVTDPIFSNRIGRVFTRRAAASTVRPEDLRGIVGILISHGHHDHLDYPSLKRLGRAAPIVVPWGLAPHLRLHGHADVRTLRPWESVELDQWRVEAVPARHFGGRLPLVHTSGYQGYVVSGPATIYFAGDTGFDAAMFREIARRFRLDLAVLPIAGAVVPWYRRNHMNAVEALEAFRILGASRMLPIHFETFPASFEPADRPRQLLLAEAARLGISDQVTVLSEGERLRTPDGPGVSEPRSHRAPPDEPERIPAFLAGREAIHVE